MFRITIMFSVSILLTFPDLVLAEEGSMRDPFGGTFEVHLGLIRGPSDAHSEPI